MQIEELQNSLGLYYLAMNPGYKYVAYQQERVVTALEALERGDINRLMIFMPPGHSKSDLGTRAFIPWVMGKHPRDNVIVLSYSADLATKDFGSKIKSRMNEPLHVKVFPDSKLSQDSHSSNMFRTIKGGTFYAMGLDGTIAGKRAKWLVMDDLIKNDKDADSEVVQDFIFNTYQNVVKNRLEAGAAMIVCAHRWRVRDIYGRILEEEGTVENGGDWTVIKLKGEDPPDSGNYLWSEHYGVKRYEDAKKTDSWAAMYQQEPGASKLHKFKEEWLQFYDIPISPKTYNTYMLVDPAGAKGKKSDYTSIQVWAAGQDRKLFLADWVHDRLDPGERVEAILRLTQRWKQRQTLYEQYGLVSDTYYLTEKMRERKLDQRVYPIPVGKSGVGHNRSKDERINGIIPFWREGRIWLPRHCARKIYDGRTIDLTQRFIDEEFIPFKGVGSIAHEDDLDCMARLTEQDLQIRYMEKPEEDRGTVEAVVSGGWEAVY